MTSKRSNPAEGRVLFIPHGGGPLPLVGDPGHQSLVEFLQRIPDELNTPSAIVIISAHWEASQPTIISGPSPELLYDYYGFPPETYQIKYPVPGHPALAKMTFELLRNKGIDARFDDQRGFDHGVFVPLKIMLPQANIPCVQLSLNHNLDPASHINMGQALRTLRDDNVLIVGSGLSFHNMQALMSFQANAVDDKNRQFEAWLVQTCAGKGLSVDEREQRLIEWEQAPFARYCHPREEHLLPLHVCFGAAGSTVAKAFEIEVLGKMTSAFLW